MTFFSILYDVHGKNKNNLNQTRFKCLIQVEFGLPGGDRTHNRDLGELFYRKSGVKNAIFLDFRAFYAPKFVYFKAFCSFCQVIFASNTNFNTKNYTKTIPILIPDYTVSAGGYTAPYKWNVTSLYLIGCANIIFTLNQFDLHNYYITNSEKNQLIQQYS